MTAERLEGRVTLERLDHFMARANAIYYATHDPYADFTTSPEISQVFGEIMGLWAAVSWRLLGCPAPVLLVEVGPGRGTLMADALRAVGRAMPDFAAALRLHLIETSPRLRAAQAIRLPQATWHDTEATLPDQPILLLANEFLDALPIRQFVRRGSGWSERFVATVAGNGPEEMQVGHWVEQLAEPLDAPAGRGAAEGEVLEINQPARTFVAALASRLCHNRGVALFLDYGPQQTAVGDSLQALANRRPVDPLSPPGFADLTAHVDFADLARIARGLGATVQGPCPQGPFLTALGLFERTGRLVGNRAPAEARTLIEAAQRLAAPDAMGQLFKVMAIGSPACPPLPGFPPPRAEPQPVQARSSLGG